MPDQGATAKERHVLVINDGKRRAVALDAAAYSIGRDPSNAIVLGMETISRQHAMLLRVPIPGTHQYRYRIIDGNSQGKPSANGIFVENQKCQSRDLANGDVIRFGTTVEASYLTVSMGDAEFIQYLESISYQSLKSNTVNAKETLVAACLLEDEVGGSSTVISPPSSSPTAPTLTPPEPRRANSPSIPWAETVHEGNLPIQRQSPYRLWMILIPTVLVVGMGIAGGWMLMSKSSSSSSTVKSVSETPTSTAPRP